MIISLKPRQSRVFICDKRFRVVVAGRRSGKTYLACTELCRAAWGRGRLALYIAPTYKQAKRIAWNPLKEFTRPFWASRPNETDLRIELISGGTIALRGADNYDSLRGEGLDFAVLDEFASMAPEAWTQVIRPALSDRLGGALFIGTPQGFNHFYDLFQAADKREGWAAEHFTTEQGGIVSVAELETARHEMDERTYRQEYQGSFENVGVGKVYYAFDRVRNVRPLQYNPNTPLLWSLDFNVGLHCSVLGQRINDTVHILDELVLPHSNTFAASEEFLERTRPWTTAPELPELGADAGELAERLLEETARQLQPGPVIVYVHGDATGD